jgi:hypothetical protein
MDALTLIGLIGNILAFVDFGQKSLALVKSIYTSTTGAAAANLQLEASARRLRDLATKLETKRLDLDASTRADNATLVGCAADCRASCDELLALLDSLRAKKLGSRRYSVVAGIKSMWKQGKTDDLVGTLDRHQNQLNMIVNVLSRCVWGEGTD